MKRVSIYKDPLGTPVCQGYTLAIVSRSTTRICPVGQYLLKHEGKIYLPKVDARGSFIDKDRPLDSSALNFLWEDVTSLHSLEGQNFTGDIETSSIGDILESFLLSDVRVLEKVLNDKFLLMEEKRKNP